MPPHLSMLEFARQRLRHAGSQILDVADPWFLTIDTHRAKAEQAGVPFVSFAHYDYLGLLCHADVQEAARGALDAHGTTVSASRLVGGEREMQRALEKELASFTGYDDALVLISGYLTNVAILGHLLGKNDLILYDALCHNSIAVGLSASRAVSEAFRHNDLDHLEALLAQHRDQYKRCLITVESLYSMDGDLVDLPALLDLKRRYGCWLLVDEAHSIGTVGATGRGICEHFQVNPAEVDLMVGTLSKALVSTGGYVAAAAPIIHWLRYTLPGFVFSVGISPAATAAAGAALKLLATEPDRVCRQQERTEYFLKAAKDRGLDTAEAIGRGLVPLHMTDDRAALMVSDALLQAGIYVPPILRIGVPSNKPRLRCFVSALHTHDDIDRALNIVSKTLETAAADRASVPAECGMTFQGEDPPIS